MTEHPIDRERTVRKTNLVIAIVLVLGFLFLPACLHPDDGHEFDDPNYRGRSSSHYHHHRVHHGRYHSRHHHNHQYNNRYDDYDHYSRRHDNHDGDDEEDELEERSELEKRLKRKK